MYMKKNFSTALIVLLFFSLACDDDDTKDPSSAPAKALDQYGATLVNIEQLTNELEFVAREALTGTFTSFLTCSNVQTSIDGADKIYTIIFSGGACADNRKRSGQLRVAVNQGSLDVMIQTTTLVRDAHSIEGIFSFQPVTQDQKAFTKLVALNGKWTEDGRTITFTANKQYAWVQGRQTPAPDDDRLEVVSGDYFINISALGLCEAAIQTPLQIYGECAARLHMPVSGKVTLETLQNTNTVSFGDGGCASSPTQE
jgi:hypothetical protein